MPLLYNYYIIISIHYTYTILYRYSVVVLNPDYSRVRYRQLTTTLDLKIKYLDVDKKKGTNTMSIRCKQMPVKTRATFYSTHGNGNNRDKGN